MISTYQLKDELANFNGTEAYHKLTLGNLKATDGVAHLANVAEAFWLIDAIASWQNDPKISELGIQFWKLEVHGNSGQLYCIEDTGRPKLITQHIGYTDFPEGVWEFYVTDNVIMLPNEY